MQKITALITCSLLLVGCSETAKQNVKSSFRDAILGPQPGIPISQLYDPIEGVKQHKLRHSVKHNGLRVRYTSVKDEKIGLAIKGGPDNAGTLEKAARFAIDKACKDKGYTTGVIHAADSKIQTYPHGRPYRPAFDAETGNTFYTGRCMTFQFFDQKT
ncbi:hypothetical protein PsAD46_05245 [Pseudovibrio sp. Ad46]|nr:hypothetical protein PsAD46_05245 [Pseudovibrio sp. Ad46]KZK99511.1 hypothetical protein PsAD5_01343 [Pseudovibrio sp. Ad5]